MDLSYSNDNSGIMRNLIRVANSDLIKPFALSNALNVSSISLSLPSTVKNTLACDHKLKYF